MAKISPIVLLASLGSMAITTVALHAATDDNATIYNQDFDSGDAFSRITVIDSNNDNTKWQHDSFNGCASLGYNRMLAADDWMILPELSLLGGETYTLTFTADLTGWNETERIEVKFGSEATVAAMTGTILESTTYNTKKQFTATFVPATDGKYFIGFHGISDSDQSMVRIDDIIVKGKPAAQEEPDTPVQAVELPYFQDFSSISSLSEMTILNENGDFKKWELKNGAAWLQYNGQENADDWLILPPMKFNRGMAYRIKFNAWAHLGNAYPERIEVKWGASPEALAMTETIMEPTMLTNKENEPELFEYSIVPDYDGIAYIGFHGISDADMSGIFLDNILVEEQNTKIPAASTDLIVTNDVSGSNSADISFTAPNVDVTGNPLQSLSKIEILRNETLIYTFENPRPGESLTYTDADATHGLTTYHVIAYTDAGAGMDAFTTIFVGINTPAPCPSVSVTESISKPGQVTITWETPETDVEGNPINPDMITYEVVERNGYYSQQVIKSNLRGNSYTYQAVPAGEPQEFKQWGVYAYTANGTLHDTRTGTMAIGTPYDAPYHESFTDGETSTIISTFVEFEEGEWTSYTDENTVGVKSQDGDNGFSGLLSQNSSVPAMLSLGKVSLNGVRNPGLSFYLFNPERGLGAILDELSVEIFCDNQWTQLYSVALEDLALADRWNRIMISLDDYAGKTVSLRFIASIVNGGLIMIDNIYIGELYEHNIGATEVTAPARVKPDTDFTVNVTVANLGTETAEGYEVTLMRNGKPIATLPGKPIEVCDEVIFNFTDCVSVAEDDQIYYQATVSYSLDENIADNISRRATVILSRSLLPAPGNLTATADGNSVALTWAEPDNRDVEGVTVTEGFELADSWAIDDVVGWTFIDGDGAKTISLQSYTYPGKNAAMAYQVFDRASKPFDTESGFDANSGTKFLASFCSQAGVNDDWAISPRLSGNAQTITLAASSFEAAQGYEYLESFEILYSESGTDINDFTLLSTVRNVPAKWTDYQFRLPEGALYFAIHCISADKFIFMVDDITYEPDILGDGLSLIGYNIYRDGTRINNEPVEDLEFIDNSVTDGDHTYVVTAVYTTGESGLSNLATAMVQSGLLPVTGEKAAITVENREIVVTGNIPATIYTIAGQIVTNLPASSRSTIAVAPGLYIVKAGNTTVKVLVK